MYVDFSHIPRTNPAGRIFMRSSWGGPNLVSITPGSSGFSASSTMANKKGAMKKQFKLMAASRKFGPDSLPGAVPEVEPPADERQEPAHEKEEESYTVAEEIMYMAKEKELNAQLEALSEELGFEADTCSAGEDCSQKSRERIEVDAMSIDIDSYDCAVLREALVH